MGIGNIIVQVWELTFPTQAQRTFLARTRKDTTLLFPSLPAQDNSVLTRNQENTGLQDMEYFENLVRLLAT